MKLQYYYKGAKPTHSRIQCLEQNADLQFCIGSEFDAYDFTRPLAESFEDLIVERLLQLRKKYNYLRLWFSGGKDSRIILDAAIKQGIQIDEIIIIVHMPAGRFSLGQQVETEFNAIRYIKEQNLTNTRLSIIELEDRHYTAVFKDLNWIHCISDYTLHAPLYCGTFFTYVNPEFRLVEKTADIGDITGNVHPHIEWTGEQWQFFYVDHQHSMNTNNYVENFLTSNDMPELCHAYVRDQTAINHHVTKHTDKASIPPSREYRDCMPAYRDIVIPNPELEMPKIFDGTWKPYPDSPVWKANLTYKQWVNCAACFSQSPLPTGFQNYIENTPWDLVTKSLDCPGIVTQTFCYA
jgi:hypothetical protein